MWYENIGSMLFRFVTKHACDGQTDGRTELRSQDRASIAALRGKNWWCLWYCVVLWCSLFTYSLVCQHTGQNSTHLGIDRICQKNIFIVHSDILPLWLIWWWWLYTCESHVVWLLSSAMLRCLWLWAGDTCGLSSTKCFIVIMWLLGGGTRGSWSTTAITSDGRLEGRTKSHWAIW